MRASREALRMRYDCDDGEDRQTLLSNGRIRVVVEKHPIGTGSLVLHEGLPDSLSVRSDQRLVFMGVQTWMFGVQFQQPQGLENLPAQPLFCGVGFQSLQLPGCFFGE